jgi:PhnB protein
MSIVPQLVISGGRGAEAIDFYKSLFDAREERRVPAQDGKRLMHSELLFAGGVVHVNDDFSDHPAAEPALVSMFIGLDKAAQVDALSAKAKAMGARIIQEPQDMFWGDRFAMFADPFGHRWHVGAPKA